MVKAEQPSNIAYMLVTFSVLKLDKSSEARAEQPWNIHFMPVARSVIRLDEPSMVSSFVQYWNQLFVVAGLLSNATLLSVSVVFSWFHFIDPPPLRFNTALSEQSVPRMRIHCACAVCGRANRAMNRAAIAAVMFLSIFLFIFLFAPLDPFVLFRGTPYRRLGR